LQTLGYRSLVLDLGHVAVLDVLFSTFGLSPVQQTQLIDLYQRKALPELKDWLACESLPSDQALIIGQLPRLMGAPSVLAQVKGLVSDYPSVVASVEAVEQLVASLADQADLTINIDFTELRGHQYHTGLVFSLYDANTSWVLVQGGRYDNIGASFGYQRPATGFTLDLKLLTDHVTLAPVQKALAPSMLSMTPEAKTLVDSLRAKGVQVLHASETPTLESALALGCASFFEFNGRAWTLKTC
jgi:ATP phosphoribosyltransferase regulatory subunit